MSVGEASKPDYFQSSLASFGLHAVAFKAEEKAPELFVFGLFVCSL